MRVTPVRGVAAASRRPSTRLRASYAAIPPARRCGWPSRPPTCSGRGTPPARPGSTCPGLDGVIAVDAAGADRRRAGHVHLRAPRRRDAAARADPAGRAAAAHDHARRRGDRARHRVDELPQRAAARVRRSRWTSSPAPARWSPPGPDEPTCSTRSPTPTARSATPPGCGSSSSGCRSHVALRHVRFDDAGLLAKTVGRDRRDRRVRRRAGRRPRRRRVRAGRATT